VRTFIKKTLAIDKKTTLDKNEECFLLGIKWSDASSGFRYYISVKDKGKFEVDSSDVEISHGRVFQA
jgi:hypothetical protein